MAEPRKLKLSIGVLAYNHEKYIAQALESILMQRVNFDYEIIVGEDCSNDNTRNILLLYRHRYPSIIKLILHKHNQGMNGNADAVRFSCQGEFLAFLDGDNYWSDPYKLQKQVDFLETHPQYIGCSHKVTVVDAVGSPSKERYYAHHCRDKVFTLNHVEKGFLPGHSSTYLFRNIFQYFTESQQDLYRNCNSVGDSKLALCLALNGDVYCSDEVMGAFRFVTDGNSFSSRSYNENLSLEYCFWVNERIRLAKECFGKSVRYHGMKLDIGYHAFVQLIKRPNRQNLHVYKEVMRLLNRKWVTRIHIFCKCMAFPVRILWRIIKSLRYARQPNVV